MKTLKFIFLLSIALIILMRCNCNDQPRIKKDVLYPDLISPIYYIDTIQINTPRVAIIDSVPYIFSFNKTVVFSNKEDFLNQKGLIRFLTPDLHFLRTIDYMKIYEQKKWKKTLQHLGTQNEFYFDELFQADDSVLSIPIYKFAFEPQMFLLTFIASIDSVETAFEHEDSILGIFFSNDYKLALAPIYHKQDLKIINNLWDHRLHCRDKD